MKKHSIKNSMALVAIMLLSLLTPDTATAQQKVSDKEIIGVWVMTSMKYDGEDKELISDSYSQVKVFRANGEYACAEIAKRKDGKYVILPHEYGTYWLKNGIYSEMGRKPIKWNWIDKVTTKGKWYNRNDAWRKVVNMPNELSQHIVDKCKAAQDSPEKMQKLMKQYIFSK